MKSISILLLAGVLFSVPNRAPASIEARIEQLENRQAEIYHTLSSKKAAGSGSPITEQITLSGLIEVEAAYESIRAAGGADARTSDIVLATAQLGFDVEVTGEVSADLVLLYEEEPDGQLDVDEAAFRFDDGRHFARIGRQYLPFGAYISHFISDPILLDLGETRATAALVGNRFGNIEFSLFVFNGSADQIDADDHIGDFGASLSVASGASMNFGASYLSDLAETGAELTLDAVAAGERTYSERAGGWSAYLLASIGSIKFSGEVLAASEKLVDLGDDFDEPIAWNLEAAYYFNDDTELAFRVEGSDEVFDVPELQYGACVSRGIGGNLSLSLEYLHGEFDETLNPPLDSRNIVTTRLAVEF